ncbi:MAG TPA: ATP-binding protein [Pirellulales bacterium]|jgi:signal transduction histidine kinase|nr:ATP-binding protein [Pirellulales bacterium]
MFDWLNKLSLRAKLLGGFAIVVGLMATACIVALVSQSWTQRAIDRFLDVDDVVESLSAQSGAAMLKARQHEKDFLLHYRLLGQREATARYMALLGMEVTTIHQNMARIRPSVQDPAVKEQTRQIDLALDRYQDGVTRFSKQIGGEGQAEVGLEGALRRKLRSIEVTVRGESLPELVVDLLAIQGEETDYLLRGLDRDTAPMHRAADLFKLDVARAALADETKSQLQARIDEYLTLFDNDAKIAALVEKYRSDANIVEPLLEALQTRVRNDQILTRDRVNAAVQASHWVLMSVGGVAIGLGLVVAQRCTRSITQGVGECLTFAEKLARGHMETRLSVRGRDEFGTMAVALNGMADAMAGAQRALQTELDERQRTNRILKQEIEDRIRAEQELEAAHQQLMVASRRAGMAEIASGVLHNVGNVLNSVNVSATLVLDRLQQSKVDQLTRVSGLIEQHQADLGQFITLDPKGKQVPGFLKLLAGHLTEERAQMLEELNSLHSKVEHIKTIVATQQSYAGVSGVIEPIDLHTLLDDAIKMNSSSFERHGIAVQREYAELPKLLLDKQKLLQILVNLVKNAKDAMLEPGQGEHRLDISTRLVDEDRLQIVLTDTGVGIPPENLLRIFSHGFTTKKTGHGFGLHSCANAAKEMGGSLQAESDGPGTGATFTLELPFQPAEEPACCTT